MSILHEVVFKGRRRLWFIGAPRPKEGALVRRPADYRDGTVSWAYLFPDGSIRRYGVTIGTMADVVPTGRTVTVEPSARGFARVLGNLLDF